MPIHGADGAIIGDMFYVAYTLPPRSGETRPIAFIWNGGSGANSTPCTTAPSARSGSQTAP